MVLLMQNRRWRQLSCENYQNADCGENETDTCAAVGLPHEWLTIVKVLATIIRPVFAVTNCAQLI